MNPLVTVAVTTLNRPHYLRETLLSVLAQDYTNLDILVSDNGSDGETLTMARALVNGDPRVRFRRNETTVPVDEHFNQCVEATRGEFFLLLSDDDLLNPWFVSEVVGVAMRYPGVNVVVPSNVTIDERGAVLRTVAKPESDVLDGPTFVCHWLYQRTPLYFACLATVLMRTDVIRRFGGYQDFARGQNIDNLLFLQCAITGRVGFAHGAVFSWRVYNRSFGTTSTPPQIAESSRQFVQFLRRDPRTRQALAALPAARRSEIVYGVRLMTVQEFLYRMKFSDVCGEGFRRLLTLPFDGLFYRLVLRLCYGRLRTLFPTRRADHRAGA